MSHCELPRCCQTKECNWTQGFPIKPARTKTFKPWWEYKNKNSPRYYPRWQQSPCHGRQRSFQKLRVVADGVADTNTVHGREFHSKYLTLVDPNLQLFAEAAGNGQIKGRVWRKITWGEVGQGALKLARNPWLKNNKVETRWAFSLNSLSEHLWTLYIYTYIDIRTSEIHILHLLIPILRTPSHLAILDVRDCM